MKRPPLAQDPELLRAYAELGKAVQPVAWPLGIVGTLALLGSSQLLAARTTAGLAILSEAVGRAAVGGAKELVGAVFPQLVDADPLVRRYGTDFSFFGIPPFWDEEYRDARRDRGVRSSFFGLGRY